MTTLEPEVHCDHCGTFIEDRSTIQSRGDEHYCCPNCANLAGGDVPITSVAARCAHCEQPIVFIATKVERDDQVFCCLNCATVHAGARTS